MRRTMCIVSLVSSLSSCGGDDALDIGHDQPTTRGESIEDYAAVWEGYAELYEFDSSSDRIRLVVGENGAGTLEVGEAPLLPPATDPDDGYPPGPSGDFASFARLVPGFQYPLTDVSVESSRLRLATNPLALYRDWCRLQAPVVLETAGMGEPVYGCAWLAPYTEGSITIAPDGGDGTCSVTRDDVVVFTSDCGKLNLCGGGSAEDSVCACMAEGCDYYENSDQLLLIRLDAALEEDGTKLVGTLGVLGGDGVMDVTVRMTRE